MRKLGPRSLVAAVFLIVACTSIATIWWWSVRSYDRPPQTYEKIDLAPRASSIVIPIVISLTDIQTRINTAVPSTLYSIDQGMDDCVPAKWIEACVLPNIFTGGCSQNVKTKITPGIDCHLSGAVTRRAAISVGGSNTNLTLSMPVNVSVTAKGRGEIGKNISVTASADSTVKSTLKLDIDEDWQPKIDASISYEWDDPPHAWILGFKITFADKVNPKVQELISELQRKLPSLLADLKLKEKVQEQWQKAFEPIRVQESPEIWLAFSPQTVGYGGYEVKEGALKMTFMVAGNVKTHLGAKPEAPTPSPLPKLLRELPKPGLDLSLALSADYTTLVRQIKQALKAGEYHVLDVRGLGNVKLSFKDVTIYQSTDKSLAIGLTLDAEPPNSFFATKGTVWLLAQFGVDNDRKVISPTRLGVYSRTDNMPVDLLISLIELAPVNDALRRALTYDFSEKYQELLHVTNEVLTRQLTPDLYLDGHLDKLRFESVVAGATALTAIVSAKGELVMRSGAKPPAR